MVVLSHMLPPDGLGGTEEMASSIAKHLAYSLMRFRYSNMRSVEPFQWWKSDIFKSVIGLIGNDGNRLFNWRRAPHAVCDTKRKSVLKRFLLFGWSSSVAMRTKIPLCATYGGGGESP